MSPPEGPARPAEPGEGAPEIFFRTFATPVVFALIALGFHFFLRGHNAPGGGFIAGLIVAVAALLARMARDLRLLRIRVELLVPVGLLIALVTGVVPMMFGASFLTSDYGYLDWPLIGEFEWATAVAFDAGVFLVVIGTTITIIDLLADDRNLNELGTIGMSGDDPPEAPIGGADDHDEDAEEEREDETDDPEDETVDANPTEATDEPSEASADAPAPDRRDDDPSSSRGGRRGGSS